MPLTLDQTWNAFTVGLRAAVASVWPDVVPNGIFEANQVVDIPWETFTLPFAVLVWGEPDESEDWGLDTVVFDHWYEVYRVQAMGDGGAGLRTQLGLLANKLMTPGYDLAVGQVVEISSPTASRKLYANQVFVTKNYPQRAGRLLIRCLVGEVIS